jgi:hypothetical protein
MRNLFSAGQPSALSQSRSAAHDNAASMQGRQHARLPACNDEDQCSAPDASGLVEQVDRCLDLVHVLAASALRSRRLDVDLQSVDRLSLVDRYLA